MIIPFSYITHAQCSFDQIKLIKDTLTIFFKYFKGNIERKNM